MEDLIYMGLIPIDLSELVASGGMNAIQYQYFNQLMNHRTIVLNDEIDGCLIETISQFELIIL